MQAPIVVSSVLAMGIYRSESIADLFKGVSTAIRRDRDMSLNDITPEAFYHARARLGPGLPRRSALEQPPPSSNVTFDLTQSVDLPPDPPQPVCSSTLLRGLIVDAGRENGIPPLEIRFVGVLRVVRRTWMRIEDRGEGKRRGGLRRMLQDIAECRMDRPRRKRVAPRSVRQFNLKRKWHRTEIRDFKADLRLVDPPLKS